MSKSRKYLFKQTFLVFVDDGFTVMTLLAVTKVKSSGRWRVPVSAPAQYLKAWVSGLPKTREITLATAGRWLQAGKLRLRAAPVAEAMLAKPASERPDGFL